MIDVFKFIIFIVGMVAIIIAGLRLVRAKDEFELACLRSKVMSLYVVRFEPRTQDRNNPPRFLSTQETTRIWKRISAAIFECGDGVIEIKTSAYTNIVSTNSYAQMTVIFFEVSFELLQDARDFTKHLVGDVQNIQITFSESIELEA